MAYFIVFVGAGLGGALRHGVNVLAARLLGFGFPWGTLFVNVAGAFALGVIAELALIKGVGNQPLRLFLTTGLLGGFTTFSAFGLETLYLIRRGDLLIAFSNVAFSVAAGLLALWIGLGAVLKWPE